MVGFMVVIATGFVVDPSYCIIVDPRTPGKAETAVLSDDIVATIMVTNGTIAATYAGTCSY